MHVKSFQRNREGSSSSPKRMFSQVSLPYITPFAGLITCLSPAERCTEACEALDHL